MIKKELQHKYEIYGASDGVSGIEKANDILPDIILLDVEMPHMNGYEVCEQLKHNDSTKDIPIIFLSSLNNLRARMLGYEAGAVDFIIKPFIAGELIAKIDSLVEIMNKSTGFSEDAKRANEVAFSAMRNSSELSLIVKFIEQSYSINSLEILAQNFFNLSNHFELNCSLMFISEQKRSFYGCNNSICSALETEVISTIYDKGGRFIDFGCRTQINYPRVSLLIKNMPLQDREAYGRYKDFFPPVLSAIDAKLQNLDTEINTKTQTKQLNTAFKSVTSTLLGFGNNLEINQEAIISLLRNMLSDLENNLLVMGLEEDQEKSIVSLIDSTIVSAQKVIDTTSANKKTFNTIITVLNTIAKRQQKIADMNNEAYSKLQEVEFEELDDDVELF